MTQATPPPGRVTPIGPADCLVLAPHYDDETLGCGGLLHQLANAGSRVEVLFLSDGRGGVEVVPDPADYGERRRREAEAACAALGVTRCYHLDLPDGGLQFHQAELREGLAARLRTHGWQLLLAPGPLEITEDHQATFKALHDVLTSWRPGSDLGDLSELRVLLYEINHPAYPNLLVDVSAELGILEAAMSCYPSQQERHDYLAAGIGLRRYRTHSLAPEVQAVEAFYELTVEDFVQHDRATLIRRLGGAPEVVEIQEGPVISLVMRTCERPELLGQALASVAASSYRNLEVVLVVDGGGAAPVPSGFPFPVHRVDLVPNRGRSGAANAGVAAANGDFVAFLDDDDVVGAEHFAHLAGMVQAADVRVAYSDAAVVSLALDGTGSWRETERRLPYSRDFDPDLLLVDNYIPLNTLLIDRSLLSEVGPFDEALPFFEDWDLLIRLAQRSRFHHLPRVTCEYRHFQGGGHILGQRPTEHPDFLAMKARVVERYRELLTPDRLARVVDTLRREAVEGFEGHRAMLRDRDRALRDLEVAQAEFHAQHGEVVGLRQEVPALRAKVEEQEEHLRRLYAEIERLGSVIEEMQGTRAWRVHEWLQRRRR